MIVVCSSVVRRDWGRRCMSSVMSTQTRIGRMCGGRRISRRATWHGFEGWLLQMFPYIPFSLGNGEALDGRGLEGEAGERGGSVWEGVDSMGEEYTLDYTVCSGLTGLDSTVTQR